LSSQPVAHARLRNLRLTGPPLPTAEAVVGWLGAVQAQDYGPAKWSIGQRGAGLTDAAVERAYAAGAILRTHVLRPTWHFVLPADIRWLLELTRPRVHALSAYGRRREQLDPATLGRSLATLADALRGGRHLTRDEVAAELLAAGIEAQGPRLAHLLMHAELEGLVCSGPPRGKAHTYALLSERAPPARPLGPDEALVELTCRYFTSHGPASARDLHWWSSLSLDQIRRGIDLAGSLLRSEVIDGVSYWFGASTASAAAGSPRAHLLQMFDEYLVGYSETRRALDVAGLGPALFQTINVRSGAVILDSQLAGTWRRAITRGGVVIEAQLAAPPDASAAEALHTAAQRYAAFLGLPATVRLQ
jgi:Winged helix DNA-binding domain